MLVWQLVATAALLTPAPRGTEPSQPPSSTRMARRDALLSTSLLALTSAAAPLPAAALIKGSSPPPKMSGPKERKCKSIDECEALGEAERRAQEAGQDQTIERTLGGDRYRDVTKGTGKEAASGDAVEIRYRVMRLGTKARDGLTGEGQTIFSYGFGEDDDKEGDKLAVELKGQNLVAGVNDAIVGMQPGGRRRVLVRPERGWRRLDGSCAEGTKSLSLEAQKRTDTQDGNLVFKADIGAAIENENACQNKVSLPQPRSYGGRQRFGRRFDESLLVELDLVGFADSKAVLASSGVSAQPDVSSAAFRCKQNPFADGCDDGVPVSQ